jgi:hypothetical protein
MHGNSIHVGNKSKVQKFEVNDRFTIHRVIKRRIIMNLLVNRKYTEYWTFPKLSSRQTKQLIEQLQRTIGNLMVGGDFHRYTVEFVDGSLVIQIGAISRQTHAYISLIGDEISSHAHTYVHTNRRQSSFAKFFYTHIFRRSPAETKHF